MISRNAVHRSVWVAILGATVLVGGCAEGFATDPPPDAFQPPASVNPITAGPSAGSPADEGPTDVYMGEACQQGDQADCVCDDGRQGTKTCRFDMDSPTRGTFGECGNCRDPEPVDTGPDEPTGPSCVDGEQNGNESDVDCGGDCPSCLLGRSCGSDADCSAGECAGGTCQLPEGSGGGGGGGGGVFGGGSDGCGGGCNNDCFPVGVLACCAGDRCGCTWAPGAYCF